MIIDGRIIKSPSEIGMPAPLNIVVEGSELGLHEAHTIVTPLGRSVPVRLMISSEDSVEIKAGKKFSQFCSLIESCSKLSQSESLNCSDVISTEELKQQIQTAINLYLSSADRQLIGSLLSDFSDVFEDSLGHTNVMTHEIDTCNSMPVKQRIRRLSFARHPEAELQIENMLKQDVIRHSTSLWSRSIILVQKKKVASSDFASITAKLTA